MLPEFRHCFPFSVLFCFDQGLHSQSLLTCLRKLVTGSSKPTCLHGKVKRKRNFLMHFLPLAIPVLPLLLPLPESFNMALLTLVQDTLTRCCGHMTIPLDQRQASHKTVRHAGTQWEACCKANVHYRQTLTVSLFRKEKIKTQLGQLRLWTNTIHCQVNNWLTWEDLERTGHKPQQMINWESTRVLQKFCGRKMELKDQFLWV